MSAPVVCGRTCGRRHTSVCLFCPERASAALVRCTVGAHGPPGPARYPAAVILDMVVCPAAPWLIDAVAPLLAADPAVPLAAVRQAAADLRTHADRILAVVPPSRTSTGGWVPAIPDDLGPSPYGRGLGPDQALAAVPPLPGAVWVARTLLGPGPLDALVVGSETDHPSAVLPPQLAASVAGPVRWGLLVLADGARCHGEDAPSARDDRSDDFEKRLATALGSGDPVVLGAWAEAERGLGAVLGSTAPALIDVVAALMAAAAHGPFEVDSRYAGAPFGVGHHLARWRR